MPRCYLVKKTSNTKHGNRVNNSISNNSWSSENCQSTTSSRGQSGRTSPTEGNSAPSSPEPPATYKQLETVTSPGQAQGYSDQYIPSSFNFKDERPEEESSVLSHDGGIPIFRMRSAAETEAAHDLLELSRSLPPLPTPSVTRIAIPLSRPQTPNTSNTKTESESSSTSSEYIIYPQSYISESPISTTSPLTPTSTSEYSSDAENNPNPQNHSHSDEHQSHKSGNASTSPSVIYTYDALLITDGRSKNNRKHTHHPTVEIHDPSSSPSAYDSSDDSKDYTSVSVSNKGSNKYTCTECGKQYATSSNLSRHKQTHRSLDSQSAKKCLTCGKAYVSMPALAMHLLTHKLTHACGVCGKMFSRPWLLQGHLRSHTGEKPYGCAHCGKAFADRSNLRAHMQTHSSDKNYSCTRCRKTFALKSYLNKHLEASCQRDCASTSSSSSTVNTGIDGMDDDSSSSDKSYVISLTSE